MSIRIITISREFGSGGRTIGKELAQKLSVPCYDSEILDEVAQKSGFAKEYVAEKGEYSRNVSFSGLFRSNYNYKFSNEDIIWSIQTNVIKELAEKQPCVIVGRCADYILRGRDDVLNVFICSDMQKRAERIVNVYGESNVSPEKRLRDKDKKRASYYQFYTDMEWGNARNYDISLNSGKLGIDECVNILFEICKNQPAD